MGVNIMVVDKQSHRYDINSWCLPFWEINCELATRRMHDNNKRKLVYFNEK